MNTIFKDASTGQGAGVKRNGLMEVWGSGEIRRRGDGGEGEKIKVSGFGCPR
jgi:hypothetical protein